MTASDLLSPAIAAFPELTHLESFLVTEPRRLARLLEDLVSNPVPMGLQWPASAAHAAGRLFPQCVAPASAAEPAVTDTAGWIRLLETAAGESLHLGIPDGADLPEHGRHGLLLLSATPGPVQLLFVIPAGAQWKGHGAHRVLACAWPIAAWRIQRRDALRLQPPPADAMTLVLRTPGLDGGDASERRVPVHDLSVTGGALNFPLGDDAPQAGQLLHHARLEGLGLDPLPLSLRITGTMIQEQGASAPWLKVSCQWIDPSPESERRIQLYITQLERRLMRHLRGS